jgi:hypothetical protein
MLRNTHARWIPWRQRNPKESILFSLKKPRPQKMCKIWSQKNLHSFLCLYVSNFGHLQYSNFLHFAWWLQKYTTVCPSRLLSAIKTILFRDYYNDHDLQQSIDWPNLKLDVVACSYKYITFDCVPRRETLALRISRTACKDFLPLNFWERTFDVFTYKHFPKICRHISYFIKIWYE